VKTSEIKIGGEYAYEAYKGAKCTQVEVLEVGDWTREVFSGRRDDMGGHRSTTKGVRFRRVEQGGIVTNWCMPAQIIQPWDEYAAIKAREDAAKASMDRDLTVLESACAQLGVTIKFNRGDYGVKPGTIDSRADYRTIAKLIGFEYD
jgi:hypothetical protein